MAVGALAGVQSPAWARAGSGEPAWPAAGQVYPAEFGVPTSRPDARDPATRAEFPLDAPCAWLKDHYSRDSAPARITVSVEEVTALRAGVRRASAFFRAQPALAAPPGICMQFSRRDDWSRLEGGYALMAAFSLGPWPAESLYRRGGRIVFDDEVRHLWATVNRMPVDDDNSIEDAAGPLLRADSPLVRERARFQGFPVHGDAVVITRRERPLYRPASFERLARWVLAEIDLRYDGGGRNAIAAAIRARLEPALARMSTAERAAPGCFAGAETEFNSRVRLVVAASDPRCEVPMVEPNPDYFDRGLPRTAVQLVVLRPLPDSPPEGTLAAAPSRKHWMWRAAFWSTDWQAFRREVLAP